MRIKVYKPDFDSHPEDGSTESMDINVANVVNVTKDMYWKGMTYAEVKLIRGTYLITKESADAIRDAI